MEQNLIYCDLLQVSRGPLHFDLSGGLLGEGGWWRPWDACLGSFKVCQKLFVEVRILDPLLLQASLERCSASCQPAGWSSTTSSWACQVLFSWRISQVGRRITIVGDITTKYFLSKRLRIVSVFIEHACLDRPQVAPSRWAASWPTRPRRETLGWTLPGGVDILHSFSWSFAVVRLKERAKVATITLQVDISDGKILGRWNDQWLSRDLHWTPWNKIAIINNGSQPIGLNSFKKK